MKIASVLLMAAPDFKRLTLMKVKVESDKVAFCSAKALASSESDVAESTIDELNGLEGQRYEVFTDCLTVALADVERLFTELAAAAR